ncbi:dolichyl-phosphate-mannose--protein mannosyltransferase [Pseudomonas sp. FW215-R2]|nr:MULTISPECIES: glycosyltransferase family 39 protein [unclassified Pseudomonas]PMX03390.1 dolichyl-phosphate-mannose--protein mannosyltransferase [Pseudomonas sp. FW215-R2]PMX12788.1 dolichyl-phosphate-mannose--protein mannosyltransferase [Pseudomonas sp. FW215-L1]PMX25046.1 dolichyl-phosphate-mannose--protein mannosyltransferase [Pseudomonas sp. FW215-E1]PNA29292.1 dolichyl-phosphate-mannose--protein mannosyltransferase [Pseudomonas sp. FW215-R4]
MSSRAAISLFLLAALLFFFALGNHQLQGSTEARVAGIAMEMHLDDDWVTPRLFGEPFLEKPPLSLWLDAGAMRVFGVSPWAVRLASAVAGLLSVMLLYGMLRRFERPKAIAWTAGILLATMASYWSNVRGVGEDALLALGVTTALLAFFQAQRASTIGNSLLFAVGIAIATLSKGVLGLAMPGVVIFAYLLADNLMDKRFKLTEWLRPGLLTALGLIPLLIWLAVLYQHGGVQAVREVLLTNSVGRFSGSFVEAGHYEPFYYYIAKLPEAFLPWNILVYLGLWHFRKQLKANRYLLFFSLWIVAQFIMLTLASSKRTVYLMSMTPAAAVIAAEYAGVLFERLKERDSGFVGWIARHRQALAAGILTVVIASYLGAAQWALPKADKELSFLPLTEHIQSLQASGHQVALFQANERVGGASVFYTQSVLKGLDTDAQLKDFLSASPSNIAVMSGDSEPAAPLKVLKIMMVGRQAYYFVGY